MSEEDLKCAVDESAALYIWPNALFYAERLFALYPYPCNLLRLAETYFQSGDAVTCARLLRTYAPFTTLAFHPLADSKTHAAVRRELQYLYGVACVTTDKISDAEAVLTDLLPSVDGSVEYWLGVCSRRAESLADAATHFTNSFHVNPLMFHAFEEASKIKAGEAQSNVYSAWLASMPLEADDPNAPSVPPSRTTSIALERSVSSDGAPSEVATSSSKITKPPSTLNSAGFGKPVPAVGSRLFSAPPPPKHIPLQKRGPFSPQSGSVVGRTATTKTHSPKAGAAAAPPSSVPSVPRRLLQLLACFAEAVILHYSYQCSEAVAYLTSESFPEKDSGWALIHTAMSYFHANAMIDAKRYFQRLRQVEPWRLQHRALVYFSTCLWQLKDEHALGLLSQQLIEEIPLHAVTLCVAGNCYSLARDSRMSIQMLRRATAVDRDFAYAHTLYGYELLSVDEKGEAEAAFLQAIARDQRHYIAYGGLGEVSLRRQMYTKAQHYFSHATSINPHPSIMNRLASLFHQRGATSESLHQALFIYEQTLQRFPQHITARHQRCEVLMRVRRLDEAMQELESMRSSHPDPALLYLSLGKCAHRMQKYPMANDYYHKALDLDPRRAPMIKTYMEALVMQQKGSAVFPDDD